MENTISVCMGVHTKSYDFSIEKALLDTVQVCDFSFVIGAYVFLAVYCGRFGVV